MQTSKSISLVSVRETFSIFNSHMDVKDTNCSQIHRAEFFLRS